MAKSDGSLDEAMSSVAMSPRGSLPGNGLRIDPDEPDFPGFPSRETVPELLVADFETLTLAEPGIVSRSVVAALDGAGFTVGLAEARLLAGMPVRVQLAELIAVSEVLPLPQAFEVSVRVEMDFTEILWSEIARSRDLKPATGAADVLAAVQSEGVRVVLDSMLPAGLASRILDRLGWLRNGLVDAFVPSEDVDAPRPSPDLLLAAVRKVCPHGSDRIAKLVGNRLDRAAAEAAGCRWVVELDPTGRSGPLEDGGTSVMRRVGSLGEVPEVLLGWVLR